MRPMLMFLLIFALSACALEAGSTIGEIELTVVVNTPVPTVATVASFTPQAIASATPTLSPSPTTKSAGLNADCTARNDLPNYTVVAGDSLSSIAVRTNSSVTQLVEWNCLTNANMIVVGMRLQVAREAAPATPTATVTPTPLPTNTFAAPLVLAPMGALSVDPAIQAGTPQDWADFIIDTSQPITIYWSGIDPEYYAQIGQIEFFYAPDGTSPIRIGIDSDKSDGMTLTWTAPAEVSGRITARAAYGATGTIPSPAIHLRPR